MLVRPQVSSLCAMVQPAYILLGRISMWPCRCSVSRPLLSSDMTTRRSISGSDLSIVLQSSGWESRTSGTCLSTGEGSRWNIKVISNINPSQFLTPKTLHSDHTVHLPPRRLSVIFPSPPQSSRTNKKPHK